MGERTEFNTNTVMLLCALFLVIIPILAMIAHWGFSYVTYGFTHVPLASGFVVISLSALAASLLLLNPRRKRKIAPTMIGSILLVALLVGALGDTYLCLALAGCC